MTLPTSTRVTDPYETDGVQRDFEFDFPAFYNADTGHYGIEVRRLTALDYEVIDKSLYDIFLNDEDKSGYVRFHVAPMAGDDIYIAGDTTRSQQLNLINYGRYSAQSIEKAFDLIVALIQEFVSKVDEETRQRILADQALRDFLLIKFNQFTAEVTTKIDKHIGDINGFMSSLIPMFVCIMRKEIANYAETGMMQVINDFMDNEIEPLIAEKVNSYLDQTDFAGAVNQIVAPIAEYVPLPFESQKTYEVNQRVTLSNGDIVKSTVANNTVDPNINMSGWVKINDASQIFDKNGVSQQARNDYLNLSNEKATVQQVIDSIDVSANIVKRGSLLFKATDALTINTTIDLTRKRFDLDGNNSLLKWSGNQANAMIRIFDSSFSKVKNFILIGDATNPPLAAVLFDNNNTALHGTNEKCTVQDVIVGRKYLSDTDSGGSVNTGTPYGRVQYGVLVQPGGYGNNDEQTFRNVAVSDATVAAFSLKGDQHIWSSFENCLANASAIGYELGSNTTHYNSQSNRITDAVYDGIRNTEHQIFGMYAEHPKLVIRSISASFYVTGGKILKNPTSLEPLISYGAGGVLSLKGMTIISSTPQFNYINYVGGSVKQGGVYIKECNISNGSKRDFYRIHSATVGHQQTIIDIQHGDFIFQTNAPYSDESKATQSVAANSSVAYSSTITSQLIYGKYIHSTVGASIGATAQVPVCLDTAASRVRVMNRSGSALTIPDTQIRSMDLSGHVLQKALSAASDMSFAARGISKVNIPLFGVQLGDYIIPTVTTTMGNTYVLYGYATAANQATVVVESISTVATTLAAQIVGAAKFNEAKARYHGIHKTVSTVSVAAKVSTSFNVNVAGVQVGSHCLVAPSGDLGDLVCTAHCNSDGVITVVVYNPSSVSVDLVADIWFKVCAIF